MPTLETARLRLRPLSMEDLDWFAALRGDADVMRYIGTEGPLTHEQSKQKLDKHLKCWADNGLGMFGVRRDDDAEPVGWGGLQPLEQTAEIEVGYALGKAAWGRGFATEAARAVIEWGFHVRALDRIVAVATPENEASRRVMVKLGMHYEGIKSRYGHDCAYYSLTPESFALRKHSRDVGPALAR